MRDVRAHSCEHLYSRGSSCPQRFGTVRYPSPWVSTIVGCFLSRGTCFAHRSQCAIQWIWRPRHFDLSEARFWTITLICNGHPHPAHGKNGSDELSGPWTRFVHSSQCFTFRRKTNRVREKNIEYTAFESWKEGGTRHDLRPPRAFPDASNRQKEDARKHNWSAGRPTRFQNKTAKSPTENHHVFGQ